MSEQTTSTPAPAPSTPAAGPRVVVVAQAAPAQGGIASFAENIVADPTLNGVARMTMLNTTRQAVRTAGTLNLGNLRNVVADAWRVFRAARSADVVHVQSAPGRLFPLARMVTLCVAGRLGGAGVLCHVHSGRVNGGNADGFAPSKPYLFVLRRLPRSVRILTVSNAGTRVLSKLLPKHHVETVDNAVDVSRFTLADPKSEPVVLMFLGTISARKGLYDLADAAVLLKERTDLPPWELRVVGGAAEVGEEEAEAIRSTWREKGLGDCLVGPLAGRAVVDALADASVFVLPSHWEGQPMVILEAMSAGLPILSTTVGANVDVVGPDEGVLVPPHDVPALVDALADLVADADARVRLGQGARVRAETAHDMPVLAGRLAALYEQAARR
ncbi:glycosyltransferase family 4 protein [Kineosporia sp. A_224]|uniref:glycosyltransferase family 4 protein n=1 Tax=Kineosporia sp. A_224 TaxID=1962180 RepID=UPI000B4A9C7A|nr:glycosyltransferase [Kineosporia sp. A_224]